MRTEVREELERALETMNDGLRAFFFDVAFGVVYPRFVFQLVADVDNAPFVATVSVCRMTPWYESYLCVDVGDESGYWFLDEKVFKTYAEDEAEWEQNVLDVEAFQPLTDAQPRRRV